MSLHQQLLRHLADDQFDSPTEARLATTLRAVVGLHRTVSFGRRLWCEPCARSYPCPTVQAIARELGTEATNR